MSLTKLIRAWFALFVFGFDSGGGGSSSTSSNSTTTNTTDKRQAVSNGVGVSSDSSTVTVNALDGGAIQKAIDLSNSANAYSAQSFATLAELTKGVLALGVNEAQTIQQAGQGVNQAYQTAQALSQTQKIMLVGGLAVVGYVVVKTYGKR